MSTIAVPANDIKTYWPEMNQKEPEGTQVSIRSHRNGKYTAWSKVPLAKARGITFNQVLQADQLVKRHASPYVGWIDYTITDVAMQTVLAQGFKVSQSALL